MKREFAQVDIAYLKTRPLAAVRRLVSRAFFEGRPLTTKVRLINSITFAHFWLEKKLPQIRQVHKPLFIVGTGRSGTTFLGTLMSLHPDVGLLNEPKALWHTIYPEEDVNGNYSRGPARFRLWAKDASQETKRTAHRLFGAYLAATFSNRIVDKNPEIIYRIPFVRAIFPDAKFILLVRNGWNTCYSIARWSERRGIHINGEIHDWWGVNNRKWQLILSQLVCPDPIFANILDEVLTLNVHTDLAVVEWIVTMREGMHQMEQHPDCTYLLRYEDLVANSRQELTRLLDFCDLPFDEKLVTYAEQSITSAPIHPRFDPHPAIRSLFDKTLKQMGY